MAYRIEEDGEHIDIAEPGHAGTTTTRANWFPSHCAKARQTVLGDSQQLAPSIAQKKRLGHRPIHVSEISPNLVSALHETHSAVKE
jgi:hypothetical protein